MWPIKNKIPFVKNIIFENNNEVVTIIHEKGAHKFKKVDVLDSYITSDFYSGEKTKYLPISSEDMFFPLMLFFGFLNMLLAIWPVFLWDYTDKVKVINFSITGSYSFYMNLSILVFLSIFLALTLSYFLRVFWRFLEFKLEKNNRVRKDILIVSLNNQYLSVRFNERFDNSFQNLVDFGYVNNIEESYLKKDNSRILFIIAIILLSYVLIAPIYNWDKPYIFWQLFENWAENTGTGIAQEFRKSHENTFLYWNYFASFDFFQPKFIKYNVNPLIAFLDGINSFTFHFYILLIILLLIVISFLIVCWIFIWPCLSLFILIKLTPLMGKLFKNETANYEKKMIMNYAVLFLSIFIFISILISCIYIFTRSDLAFLIILSLINLLIFVRPKSRKYLFTLTDRLFSTF